MSRVRRGDLMPKRTRQLRYLYFMRMARAASTLATCDRAHVGAVLVRGKRIVATGYNGAGPGLAHCDDVGHDLVHGHCVRTIHAEENLLIQCAEEGVSSRGCVCYCTLFPCVRCAMRLHAAGVTIIFWEKRYASMAKADYARIEALERAGLRIISISEVT